jgi:hypothetical protein
VKGSEAESLSSFEAETVTFLNSHNTLSTKALVKLETNPRGVIDYMSMFDFMVCFAFYIPLKY